MRIPWRKRNREDGFRIDHLATDGLRDPRLFVRRGDELDRILKNIRSGRSPVAIEGGTGVGKTCLLQMVKEELRKDGKLNLAELHTLCIGPEDMLRAVGEQWGVKLGSGSTAEMLYVLSKKLSPDRLNLLVVDEGTDFVQLPDDVRPRVATTLRSLINLRAPDGRRLCAVIVAGLPETVDALGAASPTLRERLEGCKLTLAPLTFSQLREYVRRYAEFAGLDPKLIVSSGMHAVYEAARGIPREVNRILVSIIEAVGERTRKVDQEFVERVVGARPEGAPELSTLSPHRQRILRQIAKHEPHGITVPSLARELKERLNVPTSRASVSGTVKELWEKGWVMREPHGKTFKVRLTEFAKRVLTPRP